MYIVVVQQDTFYVTQYKKFCLNFVRRFLSKYKITVLLHFIFMGFYLTKNVCLLFFVKILKSTLFNEYCYSKHFFLYYYNYFDYLTLLKIGYLFYYETLRKGTKLKLMI